MKFARLTVIVALAFLALQGAARAASIVFIKGGNVWLANPDGSNQRQVTTGGFWDSPSQADDGTILAQRSTQLFRMNRQGTQLDPPIDTTFTGAPSTWAGPVAPVISPDGLNQAYGGEITDSGTYDPGCNCIVYTHEFATWWGSATEYSQPNQTLGQQDYVDPAWIDNSHLLMSSNGFLIAQVATYAIGGGDNTMTQWFSDPDPTVQALNAPAITRNDDKLAFVANVNGGLGNEIRIYRSTGPPPEATGDAANVPVDQCNLGPNSFESLRVSFAPDGQSLAYDAPDGIHLVTLTGWPSCSGITDKLIIPGGSEPYIGPANVGAGSAPPSSAFTISKRHIAADDTITLTLTSREAGRFSARATGVHKRRHHSPSRFGYGSGSARLTHAGMVRVTLKPTRSARLALRHSKRLLVTITVTFTSNGGSVRTTNTSLTVRARHP